jgi:hypothetical protein
MATSGVYTFSPTIAQIVDEVSERSGVDPATLNHRHLASLMLSFQFALRELESEDLGTFWKIDNESTTISAATLTPAIGTIDILNVSIVVGSSDVPLSRMSREDFFHMAVKTQTGQPSMWWVNYETAAPVVTFWPVPSTTYTVKYDRLRASQDITALSETSDLERHWQDAFIYNCATRFSEKFNPERVGRNEARYRETVEKAKQTKIGRGPIIMSVRSFGTSRTRRR